LLPVSGSVPPELDQSCLVRMQFQAELRQPFLKFHKKPLSIHSAFETHHKIIRVSDNHNGARCQFLAPGFDPQVEEDGRDEP
jgi:hypothetical protein